jgi:hypothetical protein
VHLLQIRSTFLLKDGVVNTVGGIPVNVIYISVVVCLYEIVVVPVKPLKNVNVTINVIGDLDMMIDLCGR